MPNRGKKWKTNYLKTWSRRGLGGGGILNIVIAKDGSIFIWNYFRGLKFWCATLFWKPLPPLRSNKRLFPKARFKRRTLHVPNLIIRFSTCKVWGMNQLGTALLYLGRLCCSIRLSLSNRMAKDQLWFIHWTSHVLNVMHKLSIINYVLFNITTLADRTHRSVTTVTSIHVVDFYTETGRLKTVLLFFMSIKKSLCILQFMVLLYFVQISRSQSPQLSPCHNRTQITLKSKQEFPGLPVYFPIFKQEGWYFFLLQIRFGTCKVRPSESTVKLYSLGRPK